MLLPILTASAGAPTDITVHGVCDGSAMVRAPHARVLVAYDEDQSLHLVDPRGGRVVASRSLAKDLKLDGERELDLEGAASDGRLAWWVGSHGNNKDGKLRPNRRTLFATTLPVRDDLSDLRVVQGPYDLLPALQRALPGVLTRDVLAKAPKKGGLNIEGLAIRDGKLYVGLRSPLTAEGHAIVAVAGTDGSIERTVTVDLGGRGIRSLEWTGERFVGLAGPVDSKLDFDLFSWDGVKTASRIDVPLASLNPESLVAIEPGRWLVLSDDGAVERTDWQASDGMRECKSTRQRNPQGAGHPSVHSRGRWLSF